VGDSFTDGLPSNFAHTSDSLGATIGYMVNAQTQFQLRYASTLSPDLEEGELEAKMFQFDMNYFW